MVIGKREISVVLLVFGAVISVYMALLANPTSAQNGGGGTTGGQGDEGCADPQPIETFSGTESQITPQFNITGDAFRLRYETTATTPDATDENLTITALDENGDFVDSVLVLDPGSDSTNILAGPGTFSLEIDAGEELQYTITVEDCVGSEPTTLQPTTPQQSQNETIIVNEPNEPEPTIINIPNKPLPPTGGLPVYGMVAGSVIAGAGLLGLGIGIRRGQRR